jgi:tetratricopeptide (TPR) repeat protein
MASPAQPSNAAHESRVLLDHAEKLLSQGKLEDSEAAFKKVIALSVDAPQGHYGLGVIQLRRGNSEAAAVEFQKCVKLDPENANAYYFLGEISENQNLPDVAIGFFKKALVIDPNHRSAQQKLEALRRGPNPSAHVEVPNEQRSAQPPIASGAGVYE